MNLFVLFFAVLFWLIPPLYLIFVSSSISNGHFPELKNFNSFVVQRNLAKLLAVIFVFVIGAIVPLAISFSNTILYLLGLFAVALLVCCFVPTFIVLYRNLERLKGGSSQKFYIRSELKKLPDNLQVFNKDLILTNSGKTLNAGDVIAVCKGGVLIPAIVDKGGKTATEVQYAVKGWSPLFHLSLYTESQSPLMRFDLSKYDVLNTIPGVQDEFERLSDIK